MERSEGRRRGGHKRRQSRSPSPPVAPTIPDHLGSDKEEEEQQQHHHSRDTKRRRTGRSRSPSSSSASRSYSSRSPSPHRHRHRAHSRGKKKHSRQQQGDLLSQLSGLVKQTMPYGLNEGQAAIRIPGLAPDLDDNLEPKDRKDKRYLIPSDDGFNRDAWTDKVDDSQLSLAPMNPARLELEFRRRVMVASNPDLRWMAIYAHETQTDLRIYIQEESIVNMARVEREHRARLDDQRKRMAVTAQERLAELGNYKTMHLNLLQEQQLIKANIVEPLHKFLDTGAAGNWSTLRGASDATYHHAFLFPSYMAWRYTTVRNALDRTTDMSTELYDAMRMIIYTDQNMYVKTDDRIRPSDGSDALEMPSYDEWTHAFFALPELFRHGDLAAYKEAFPATWEREMSIDRFLFAATILKFDIFSRHLYSPRARNDERVSRFVYHGQQLYQTMHHHLTQALRSLPGVSTADMFRVPGMKNGAMLWKQPTVGAAGQGTINELGNYIDIFAPGVYTDAHVGYTNDNTDKQAAFVEGATLLTATGRPKDPSVFLPASVLGTIRASLNKAASPRKNWTIRSVETECQTLLMLLATNILWMPDTISAPWPPDANPTNDLWRTRARSPWLHDYELALTALNRMACPQLLDVLATFFPNPADAPSSYTMFSIPRIIRVPDSLPGGRRRFFSDTSYKPETSLMLGDYLDYFVHDARAFKDPAHELYDPSPENGKPVPMLPLFLIARGRADDPFARFKPDIWAAASQSGAYRRFSTKLGAPADANLDAVLINVAGEILRGVLTTETVDRLYDIMKSAPLRPRSRTDWFLPFQRHPVDILVLNNAERVKNDPTFVAMEKMRLSIMSLLDMTPSNTILDAFDKKFADDTGITAGAGRIPDAYFAAMDTDGLFSLSYFLRELLFIYEAGNDRSARIDAFDKTIKDYEARLHKIQIDQSTNLAMSPGENLRRLQQELHSPDFAHMTQDFMSGIMYISPEGQAILEIGLSAVRSQFGYPDAQQSELTDLNTDRSLAVAFARWMAYESQATNIRHKRTYNTGMERRQLAADNINARVALEKELREKYGEPHGRGTPRRILPSVSGNSKISISVL